MKISFEASYIYSISNTWHVHRRTTEAALQFLLNGENELKRVLYYNKAT